MQSNTFDFLVFIGRFQPFHKGHLAVVKEGLNRCQQLIILCGSAHQPPSLRNPWSVADREQMIRSTLNEEENARVHVVPLMDNVYNDEIWVRNVQATVNGLITAHHSKPHQTPSIGLLGHKKDSSAYYLSLFPQWGAVGVDNFNDIHATDIRNALFGSDLGKETAQQDLPDGVREKIQRFQTTEAFQNLQAEFEFIQRYQKAWANAPYAPTFVTVDAVVVQSGHVLMVERKARPGKGLLALPGGFLDGEERLVDACLRELREETRLKVPSPVLKGSIKKQHVFDDPFRSARGRTLTHAFYIELAPSPSLPKVRGGDDAKVARWVPLAELDPSQLFEDHYFIIQYFTGL